MSKSFVRILDEESALGRIAGRIKTYLVGSPAMLRGLARIGLLVKENIIKEIEKPSGPRPKPLIGEAPPQTTVGRRLLRSIQMRGPVRDNVDELSVTIGSFGVAYAALYEKGFTGTVSIPEYIRRSKQGSTHDVRRHNRRVSVAPRPFIGPGFKESKGDIIRILRESRKLARRIG